MQSVYPKLFWMLLAIQLIPRKALFYTSATSLPQNCDQRCLLVRYNTLLEMLLLLTKSANTPKAFIEIL